MKTFDFGKGTRKIKQNLNSSEKLLTIYNVFLLSSQFNVTDNYHVFHFSDRDYALSLIFTVV